VEELARNRSNGLRARLELPLATSTSFSVHPARKTEEGRSRFGLTGAQSKFLWHLAALLARCRCNERVYRNRVQFNADLLLHSMARAEEKLAILSNSAVEEREQLPSKISNDDGLAGQHLNIQD
jgi:hypothetical protein